MWEFETEVHVGVWVPKKSFTAHTPMDWKVFRSEVVVHLGNTPKLIELVFKVCGDSQEKWTLLECHSEWDKAITHICARMAGVRKNPVAIEIKNTVSLTVYCCQIR